MIEVRISVHIRRPPEQVFAYISNFENNPRWQGGMVEAKFTSDRPLAVGSTYVQVAKFLGRRVDSTFEVIEYEPGRRVKATTREGSFPITFTRMVEPAEHGARVTAIIEGDASGFFKLAEPLLRWMVRRSIQADYRQLKGLLETQSEDQLLGDQLPWRGNILESSTAKARL